MSIRSIVERFEHPFNPSLVVLALDDGYPLVITHAQAGEMRAGSMVLVTGPVVDISDIKSYGNYAQLLVDRPSLMCSPSRDLGASLSSAFCGHQYDEASGTLYKPTDAWPWGQNTDATNITLGPHDTWVVFTAARGGVYCFALDGEEIMPTRSEYKIWSRIMTLDNYYTFCGVLNRTPGKKSSFELHCIWNRIIRKPVGPPTDRRMGEFLGIPFAASVPGPWLDANKYELMVRVDAHTPLIV
jgi:hypothetical protein